MTDSVKLSALRLMRRMAGSLAKAGDAAVVISQADQICTGVQANRPNVQMRQVGRARWCESDQLR
jgi:hypothetical protein